MEYIVIYTDGKGNLHKKSAKNVVQAGLYKKKIVQDLASSALYETIEDLKKNLDVEVKTESDVELLLDDLAESFEERVVIISTKQWEEFMKDKQVLRVPEVGKIIVAPKGTDFSDPEEYEHLVETLKEEKENV